jgi:hypothetical protein
MCSRKAVGENHFLPGWFQKPFELSLSLDKNKIGCPIEFVPNPRGLQLKQTYNFMDVPYLYLFLKAFLSPFSSLFLLHNALDKPPLSFAELTSLNDNLQEQDQT